MKRIIHVTVLAALVMGITLISCKAPKKAAQAGGQEVQEVTNVKAFRVVRERISAKVSYTGTLEANKKIAITPDIGGKIARINVREGSRREGADPGRDRHRGHPAPAEAGRSRTGRGSGRL